MHWERYGSVVDTARLGLIATQLQFFDAGQGADRVGQENVFGDYSRRVNVRCQVVNVFPRAAAKR